MAVRSESDLRFKWSSLGKYLRTNEFILEQYLLIGFTRGYLKDYEMLPQLRRNLGADWLQTFLRIATKVANGEKIELYGIVFDYSVLIHEVQLGMELMKDFGIQNGFTFRDLHNLNEIYYYYITDEFENFLSDVMREIAIRALEEESRIQIHASNNYEIYTSNEIKSSINISMDEEPEHMDEEEETVPETDNEDDDESDFLKDENIEKLKKKLDKKEKMSSKNRIRKMRKEHPQKEEIKKRTKTVKREDEKREEKKEERKKKEKKEKKEDTPKEVKKQEEPPRKEKEVEVEFVMDKKQAEKFLNDYCSSLDTMYKTKKYFMIGDEAVRVHEPLAKYNKIRGMEAVFQDELDRFVENIKDGKGKVVDPRSMKRGDIFGIYMYVGGNWWYRINRSPLEDVILKFQVWLKKVDSKQILEELSKEADKGTLPKEVKEFDGSEISDPLYEERDERFEWVPIKYAGDRKYITSNKGRDIYIRVPEVPVVRDQVLFYHLADLPLEQKK